ncbi:L-aspartate oxidase [Fastidiosibacter lacustris]|uniref:L-aspartate oxidase n=1 Tax=Fastidiosibacter lacustris TaxID=2056695 RepID=UPI000E34070F|nr:L-aspartate oxidase [Fastidiosibacter lacustris]
MLDEIDVIVIGAGTAGLTAALNLADSCKVAILCKSALGDGSSLYAQGGIAAVMDKGDSLESHIQDTLIAGDSLCDKEAVRFTVENAKSCVEWLINQGVNFTLDSKHENYYHLTMEGGHSYRRILHAADATGKEVQTTLTTLIKNNKNIQVFEYYNVVDLILQQQRCVGAYALNLKTNKIETFSARAIVLASGGASRVYQYSTNPVVSSGDGIAIAYRAGCRVANLEFNQFHPTCLYHPKAGSFLLSEALRGEGAYLRLPNGKRFMPQIDERAELAPRDIVARAIDLQMKKYGLECVYLDITHKSPEFIQTHFPMIYEELLKYGFDLTKDQIPVVPAAHYTCGGIMVDSKARTDIVGLYAAGEVTYTGLHGANRMASNSLLECLVYAFAAAKDIKRKLLEFDKIINLPAWDDALVQDSDEAIFIRHNWKEVRRCMWDYVGIVRSNKRLQRAMNRIKLLRQEVYDYYSDFTVTADLLELRNLVLVAELMIESAMRRKESRGLHYTLDYKQKDPRFLKPTILHPAKS